MNILGIDPGLDGGIALVTKDMSVIYELMPVIEIKKDKGKGRVLDLPALCQWLKAHREDIGMTYLEKVAPMPKNGSIGCFKLGDSFGALKGMLTALEMPHTLVTPQSWQKEMHAGIEGTDTKARSRIAVSRLYPGLNLKRTERCKSAHDGLAEAILIATYGHKKAGNA